MKIKINITKLKKSLKKLPEILINKAPLFLFLGILFEILIGVFIFYQYSFLVQKKDIVITEKPLILEQELLSKILKELEQRKVKFEQADSEEHPDLFRLPGAVEPEAAEPEELTPHHFPDESGGGLTE